MWRRKSSWNILSKETKETYFGKLFIGGIQYSLFFIRKNYSTMNDWNIIEDVSQFRETFRKSKYIVAVTGAGVSAESGIPTFRGKGGYWRGYAVQTLAAMSKFKENPSLVWEFYHYRREIVLTKEPNGGHICLANLEKQLEEQGKKLVIITQNIDELHSKAGSKNVVELHGTLFKTQCMECGNICENYDSPICPALLGKGDSEEGTPEAAIPLELLPRCKKDDCCGLLRPYIIWFDEDPTPENMKICYDWLNECDLCLVIGTSSVVDPANEFGPLVASKGIPVAEFNIEKTVATKDFRFHIGGPCGTTLPEALHL